MAHACNPSHSGGRDQEDPGSKPARVEVTLAKSGPLSGPQFPSRRELDGRVERGQ
jgi:hypothetical protein